MNVAESILETLNEPVLVLDASLKAVVANPAFYKALQIKQGMLEGVRIQELVASEHADPQLRLVLEALVAHNHAVENLEISCVIPPNTNKILLISARHISPKQGSSEHILVEIHDITRERLTEKVITELNHALERHGVELGKINKELEAFTYSVSHDLRTPLRLTNKITHLLLQDHGAELSPDAIAKVKIILESTQEMGTLIEDLLKFSQLSHEPMKKRKVSVNKIVQEVLGDLSDKLKDRIVEIEVDKNLGTCRADHALLKQVLLNLVDNALKFTRTREPAKIHIGITEKDNALIYFVQDNGLGFDMSNSETIFLVFNRLHKNKDIEGSGIGLTLAKRIIERHDGKIWAEGEIDAGAKFSFTLGE